MQAPEIGAWRCALALLTSGPVERAARLREVDAVLDDLPSHLGAPLRRAVAALTDPLGTTMSEPSPASCDADVADLCNILDTATTSDPLGGGLVLRERRERIEALQARLEAAASPWEGAVDAVCASFRAQPARLTVVPDPEVRRLDDGPARLRVFLLDDHEVVRRGLRDLLEGTGEFEVVGESGSAVRARAIIPALRPHVAVLDGRLPDGTGMEVCRDVRSVDPTIQALILTSYDDDDALFTAILAGAAGYVLKQASSEDLVDAVRVVAGGRSLIDPALTARVLDRLRSPEPESDTLVGITDREQEILDLIADGLTNRQIGERLCLAEKTVKNYVSTLLAKLGLERRTQAAVLATRLRR
ncbi:response regulator transcription factor [Nocardioides sp. SLBN-35]|uniref:response regulator transcription factor n=1 Tax=Nocardioides sp. SLBN-35 TaxID=2768445 RepID=UPI0028C4BEC8|nr:response regulator transcription factor [Nocardioides sp. SLBN-35]